MKEEQKAEILQKAMDKFEFEKQLNKLQEECGELTTAISRYRQTQVDATYNNLVEESVDVFIVLEQFLKYYYPVGDVEFWEKMKIRRLNGLLENEHKG